MRIPVCNSASPTEADFDILVQVMVMVMLLVAMLMMMMTLMVTKYIFVDFDIFIQTLVGTTINCPIIISDQVEFRFFSLHQLG